MKNKAIFRSALVLFVAGAMLVGTAGTIAAPLMASESPRVNVFVSFDRNPGQVEEALVRAFGGTVKYNYDIIPAIAASVPESSIRGLLNNPHVTGITLDGQVYAADTELDNAWGVKRIDSGTVHTSGNKGTGVKIGIIDSGVNYNHPDLKDVYAGGYDFVQDDNEPMDVYGHGTHVAGTACAEDNSFGVVGVAPECALYSLRVLNDDGVGSWSATIAAMDWAVANGMRVVNLSLGSSQDPGTAVKAAFDNAEAKGLVTVAAAGNSGNTAGKGDNIIYPAKYASVIAVGATDSSDKRASFSSTGSTLELMAPGVSVLSTWNDSTSYLNPQPICIDGVCYYKYGSGTSMASPHVAGVAALVIAAGVSDINGNGHINDEVRAIMNSTAEDLGNSGRDPQYGFGLVNAAAAVAAAVPPSPTVSVEVSTDKTNYVSGTDTTTVLTTVVKNENGGAISGLSSSAFVANLDGAAVSVTFTETATAGTYTGNLGISALTAGSYTIAIMITDTRGLSSSDSASFSIGPAPTEPTQVKVDSITYATTGGPSNNKHLSTTVTVMNNLSNPVSNASVAITLKLDSGQSWNSTGTTDTNGKVTFSLKNAPSGCYTTTVNNVVVAGLTWDGLTPTNGFCK